jgi:hypothetical protein
MSFWDTVFARLGGSPDEMPGETFRDSVFGNETVRMPMPQYDDNLPRLQRRLYDMPQLHIRGPQIPERNPLGPGWLTPDPGYGPIDPSETRTVSPGEGDVPPPVPSGRTSPPEPGSFYFGGATSAVSPPPPADMAPNFDYDMMFGRGYRDWRRQFSERFGEQPNYNDPDFNYRRAWQYDARPEPYAPDTVGGEPQYHWQSSVDAPPRVEPLPLKGPDHPTAWMEDFMRQYGVDPNEPSARQALAAALSNPALNIPGNSRLAPGGSDAMMRDVLQSMMRRLGGVQP